MEEPSYTPPSTVLEDSASTDYVINSIMNFKVEGSYLNLPTASLMKLEQNKDNVLPLMEYKVKNGKTISYIVTNGEIGAPIKKIIPTQAALQAKFPKTEKPIEMEI